MSRYATPPLTQLALIALLTLLALLLAQTACTQLISVDQEGDLNGTEQPTTRDAYLPDGYLNDLRADASPHAPVPADAALPPEDAALPDPPPPDLSCLACLARDEVVRGLSRLPIPLYCGHIEADARYVPIVWSSAQAELGVERASTSGRAVPGWLGRYAAEGAGAGGRVAAWNHEGLLRTDLDPLPEAGLARERLVRWLAGPGQRRVGVIEGHGEWLSMSSISDLLVANLSRAGVELEALPAPITSAALADLDAVIFGNPWQPVSRQELDALMAWLPQDRGLFLLGLGWSWGPNHPDDPTGETYAVKVLAARLGLELYEGVINDPLTLAPPADQPTYPVRPLSEWPGAIPEE